MTLSDLEKVACAFHLRSFYEPGTGLEHHWATTYRIRSHWLRIFGLRRKVML